MYDELLFYGIEKEGPEYDGHIEVNFWNGDNFVTEPTTYIRWIKYIPEEDVWNVVYSNRKEKTFKADYITFGGHTELGLCVSFADNPLREKYGSKTCKSYDIFSENVVKVFGNPETGKIEADFVNEGRSRNYAAYKKHEEFNVLNIIFH